MRSVSKQLCEGIAMGKLCVRYWGVVAFVLVVSTASNSYAQTPAPNAQALQEQIDQLKKEFGERIAALEAKLAAAQAATPTPTPEPVPAPTPTPVPVPDATGSSQAPLANAKAFNPDMSVL